MNRFFMTALFITLTLSSSAAAARRVGIKVEAGCGRYLVEKSAGGDPGSLCFSDEKPVAWLSVTYVTSMNEHRADPTKRFFFATRDWVDAVELRVFSRADGIEVPIIPRVISRGFANPASRELPREGKFFFLNDHEGVNARIELLGLKPGDYEIEAEIPGVASTGHRERFTIRRGDEDLPTIKEYYRYRADKASGDFRAYEKIIRELMAKYEPNNGGLLVQIADRSVDRVAPEETVRLYREARAMVAANWRAELAKNPDIPEFTKRMKEESIEQLTVFERALPYYREHKDQWRFAKTVVNGKVVYAWFARKGGRETLIPHPIDPADPAPKRSPARAK